MGRVLIILISIVMLMSACQVVPVDTTPQVTAPLTPTITPQSTPYIISAPSPITTLVPAPKPTPIPTDLIPIGDTIDYHPIIYSCYGSHYIFGGSHNDVWLEPICFETALNSEIVDMYDYHDSEEELILTFSLAKTGENFKFYTQDKSFWNGFCTKLRYNEGCVPMYEAEFEMPETKDMMIGINCPWNPLLRLPKISEDGLIYTIDINGDNVDEKIILEELPLKDDWITPYQVSLDLGQSIISFHEISIDDTYQREYELFFLDLNGNDALEIIIFSRGHNCSVYVYELQGNKIIRVLDYYIGD